MNAVLQTVAPQVEDRWVEVCACADIVPDTGVAALIAGQQVAVFRVAEPGNDDPLADAYYAIGHHDPFSGANVLARGLVGDLGGELVVASPIYKQHFSLRSGRCLEDAAVSVPAYAVRLVDGQVQVRV